MKRVLVASKGPIRGSCCGAKSKCRGRINAYKFQGTSVTLCEFHARQVKERW